ncbi:MAG TPA: lanthionine synthetase LanC family protein, partial [Gemmataceae bacterium]|nr:lanthionine synthetase LanC family protein [Gemmataceae bacterium]
PGGGAPCRLRLGKERRRLLPGYYLAVGDADPDDGREPTVRLYWHLTAAAAADYVAELTRRLNALDVPFRTKVLSDPAAYRRADAAVLYLPRRHYPNARDAIAAVYERVRAGMRSLAPLFTRPLAAGLGLAEDPPDQRSFGQHRCDLAARGLWLAFARGGLTGADRAVAVAAAFRDAGVDPAAPYLGPGSAEDYALPPARERVTAGAEMRRAGRDVSPTSGEFLAVASGIGRALCRAAHWDGEGRLCNWTGRSSRERARGGGAVTPRAVALGPDLYGGGAGVALFLAQLAAVTGDAECRRTALGAIACSVRQAAHGPRADRPPLSLHAGLLGVAYAAHRVAALTGEPGPDDAADMLLGAVERGAAEPHVLDLIGGSAGAIPALLALGRLPRWRRLHGLAESLGEELCRTAVRRGGAWTWDGERVCGPGVARAMLTGLAHGAAGLGLALAELYGLTGRDDFREGSRAAFAYEDELFDRRAGNWPDLRAAAQDEAPTPHYGAAWCHGAPGIGLARLRASQLDARRRDPYAATAHVALGTTATALEVMAREPGADASLCHGLAGLAEILLTAAEVLGDEGHRAGARAAAVALAGRHAERGDWPTGVPSRGPNPSLMLGTAGIGYHFLRQARPRQVPAVLLVAEVSAE